MSLFGSTSGSVTNLISQSITAGASYTWNGPLCSVCKKGYIGQHTCSVADLQTQIAWLQAHIDVIEQEAADPSPPYDGDGEPV